MIDDLEGEFREFGFYREAMGFIKNNLITITILSQFMGNFSATAPAVKWACALSHRNQIYRSLL
jgi:hypothetical protein